VLIPNVSAKPTPTSSGRGLQPLPIEVCRRLADFCGAGRGLLIRAREMNPNDRISTDIPAVSSGSHRRFACRGSDDSRQAFLFLSRAWRLLRDGALLLAFFGLLLVYWVASWFGLRGFDELGDHADSED